MKSTLLASSALLFAAVASAQPYVISTLTGDVLPPIPARGVDLPIGNLQSVAADAAGNVYFSSLNSVFRVDPNGALTHVAGNSRPGYSGDGGPATSAQLNAFGLAVDGAGNVFIATGNRIRRVSPSGIIVTMAGGGTSGLGDGRCFFMRSLHYLSRGTHPPFPTEPEHWWFVTDFRAAPKSEAPAE